MKESLQTKSVTTILPREVSSFIRRELKKEIKKDFFGPPFRIFRERDLHSCCYYHLRSFLQSDNKWEILNEPLLRNLKSKGKGAHPDIALLRKEKLVFLIELKFRLWREGLGRKDQTVLSKAVTQKKWAKKAYFIETVVDPTHSTSRLGVPYRNKRITIRMDEDRRQEFFELYKQRRKPKPRK